MLIAFSQGDNMSPVDVSRCAIRWLARRVSERERERSVPSPLRGLPRPRFFGRCRPGPASPSAEGAGGRPLAVPNHFHSRRSKDSAA